MLLEQPVRADDLAGLARVCDEVTVPVAVDEAVLTPADALAVVQVYMADVPNMKLSKSGPLAAVEIAAIAEAANLELMVKCMLESALGIHASAHVVAGTGAFSYVDSTATCCSQRTPSRLNTARPSPSSDRVTGPSRAASRRRRTERDRSSV